MEWIELPATCEPAEWLAWEEALLETADGAESSNAVSELIWFWESSKVFAVIGYGQNVQNEVYVNDCVELEVPILRRCTGGGAVVQGPGCLNYGLLLGIPAEGDLATISGTNSWIMERNRRAISTLISEPVVVRGHTDLALLRLGRELKFSGNAQRRKRRALLFHGTVLLNLDLNLISQFLRHPSSAPEYRAGREHEMFVMNLGLDHSAVCEVLIREWSAVPSSRTLDPNMIAPLVAARYGRREWHLGADRG